MTSVGTSASARSRLRASYRASALELLHGDPRLIREVASEERREPGVHLFDSVHGELPGRNDHLEERGAPCGTGADTAPDAAPHHPPVELHRVPPDGERRPPG
jgi:hypothetical protein